jgi:hypothetical protein
MIAMATMCIAGNLDVRTYALYAMVRDVYHNNLVKLSPASKKLRVSYVEPDHSTEGDDSWRVELSTPIDKTTVVTSQTKF